MGNLFMLAKCTSLVVEPIIPSLTRLLVGALQIAVPIILVIFGMIDLAKAVMANDDKVMKEATSKLIKRVIYAALIFFVVAIVKFVFGVLATSGANDASDVNACIDCFISNEDSCTSPKN